MNDHIRLENQTLNKDQIALPLPNQCFSKSDMSEKHTRLTSHAATILNNTCAILPKFRKFILVSKYPSAYALFQCC